MLSPLRVQYATIRPAIVSGLVHERLLDDFRHIFRQPLLQDRPQNCAAASSTPPLLSAATESFGQSWRVSETRRLRRSERVRIRRFLRRIATSRSCGSCAYRKMTSCCASRCRSRPRSYRRPPPDFASLTGSRRPAAARSCGHAPARTELPCATVPQSCCPLDARASLSRPSRLGRSLHRLCRSLEYRRQLELRASSAMMLRPRSVVTRPPASRFRYPGDRSAILVRIDARISSTSCFAPLIIVMTLPLLRTNFNSQNRVGTPLLPLRFVVAGSARPHTQKHRANPVTSREVESILALLMRPPAGTKC